MLTIRTTDFKRLNPIVSSVSVYHEVLNPLNSYCTNPYCRSFGGLRLWKPVILTRCCTLPSNLEIQMFVINLFILINLNIRCTGSTSKRNFLFTSLANIFLIRLGQQERENGIRHFKTFDDLCTRRASRDYNLFRLPLQTMSPEHWEEHAPAFCPIDRTRI